MWTQTMAFKPPEQFDFTKPTAWPASVAPTLFVLYASLKTGQGRQGRADQQPDLCHGAGSRKDIYDLYWHGRQHHAATGTCQVRWTLCTQGKRTAWASAVLFLRTAAWWKRRDIHQEVVRAFRTRKLSKQGRKHPRRAGSWGVGEAATPGKPHAKRCSATGSSVWTREIPAERAEAWQQHQHWCSHSSPLRL